MRIPTHKKLTPFAIVAALALCGCNSDFDTDKISPEIELSPSLLVPMTTSSTSVQYLFDEKDGAVEYYVADDEDGTNRIRFRANHDKFVTIALTDVLGIDAERSFQLAPLALADLDPQALPQYTFTTELPISDSDNATISALDCDLTLSASWNGFSCPMALTVTIGGVPTSVDVASPSGSADKTTKATITASNNNLPVTISCQATGTEGLWGDLNISIALANADNFVCSTKPFRTHINPEPTATNLASFKKISNSIIFEYPQLWFTCQNKTGLDISVTNSISDSQTDGTTVTSELQYVTGNTSYEVELNRDNSDIQGLLHPIPDDLYFSCDAVFSMPAGAESVTIHKTDTAFLGFRYNIPFDFMIEGVLSDDMIDLDEIPEGDNIEAAKLVITSDNSIPFGMSASCTFIEKGTGKALSTIEIPNVIDMPDLTEWGTTVGDPVHKMTTVVLTDENLADLHKADRAYFVSRASSNERYVAPKLEDKANIDIAIAIKFVFSNK